LDNFRYNLTENLDITYIDGTDNPLKDIKFLEETFEWKDWRASFVYPDTGPNSYAELKDVQATLEKRGYIATPRIDEQGRLHLDIHHMGDGTTASSVLQELGAIRGMAKLLLHPLTPLNSTGQGIGKSVHWLDKSVHDPAKANGVINILAEIILLFAPMANEKSDKSAKFSIGGVVKAVPNQLARLKEPKNLLQQMAAMLYLGQSITYAVFAKTNDEVALKHIDAKLKRIQPVNGDIANLQYNPEQDRDKNGFTDRLGNFVRKYPIQLGAIFNNVGMMLYAGHAILQRRWNKQIIEGVNHKVASTVEAIAAARQYNEGGIKSGFVKDILSTCLSFTGWSLMLLPRKPRTTESRDKHDGNPFMETWDRFRENPQGVSGILALGSSSLRLLASQDKRNPVQLAGESVYTLGDIALMFTKNDDYGGEKTKNIDTLAAKIADYINEMPHLFGPTAQKEFIANIAEYLKQKGLEEIGGDPEKKLNLSMNELNERAEHLARATLKRVEGTSRLDRFTYRTAELINLFPESQRTAVRAKLSVALEALPWLEATAKEIETACSTAPIAMLPPESGAQPINDIHAMRKQIAEMLAVIPGIDEAGSAIAIRHALAPFLAANKSPFESANDNPPTHIIHEVAQHQAPVPLLSEAAR